MESLLLTKAPFTLHVVPENCQKIAGVPSVWTQTRPGINSGIDPGLGPSNIAEFSPGTSAVWNKSRINAVKGVS